jgi:hypothetical protein
VDVSLCAAPFGKGRHGALHDQGDQPPGAEDRRREGGPETDLSRRIGGRDLGWRRAPTSVLLGLEAERFHPCFGHVFHVQYLHDRLHRMASISPVRFRLPDVR